MTQHVRILLFTLCLSAGYCFVGKINIGIGLLIQLISKCTFSARLPLIHRLYKCNRPLLLLKGLFVLVAYTFD